MKNVYNNELRLAACFAHQATHLKNNKLYEYLCDYMYTLMLRKW